METPQDIQVLTSTVEESHAPQEASGIGALGLDGTALLFQVVNFLILFWLLKRFVFAPLAKVIAERQKIIADSLKDAEEIRKQRDAWDQEQKKLMQETAHKSSEIIEQTRKNSQSEQTKILESAKLQSEELIVSAKKEIDAQKEQMLKEVKKEIVDLVVATTEKITHQTVKAENQKELIAKTLGETK